MVGIDLLSDRSITDRGSYTFNTCMVSRRFCYCYVYNNYTVFSSISWLMSYITIIFILGVVIAVSISCFSDGDEDV